MYRRPHIDHKLWGLFLICGSIVVTFSHQSCAQIQTPKTPLKVYVPSAAALVNYFKTDKLEYNPDAFILTARGNVEIQQDDVIIKADEIEYDQLKETLNARGDVAILEADGNVRFVNEIEIKNNIKDGVVRRLEAQMADNDIFNQVESQKNIVHKVQYPVAVKEQNNKSLLSKVWAYIAPKSKVVDGVAYAQLEPAAGGDNATQIGNVPLIVLPPENAPAKTETKTEAKGDKPKLPDAENTPAPVTPPAAESKDVPPVEATPVAATPAATATDSDAAIKAVVEDTKENFPEAKKVIKKSVKKSPKPAKKPEALPKLPKEENSGEPPASLAPESKELLEKVGAKLSPPKEKPSPKALKVNHARDMQDLFKADELPAANGQNDALGVKVENKNYKISIDYELERAYDAINSGQSEAAIETYKTILNNAPNNTQALFGLATLYHRARQFDKARPLYSKLLSIDPNHRDGFNNFLVLLADEAPHEALIELEKLEDKNPGLSTIPAQIAVIYSKIGDEDKAIGKMFRAVSLAPENLTYRYNLAIMLDKQKNYDEAAKLYRQLIEASQRGEKIPGNIDNIQQRLTFISSNRP